MANLEAPSLAENDTEKFKPLTLKMEKSDGVQKIFFEAANNKLAMAYNIAIEETCKNRKIDSEHLVGKGNAAGKNIWEIAEIKIAPGKLEGLEDEIHAKAEEVYQDFL